MITPEKMDAATFAAVDSFLLEVDTEIIQRPGWYQVITPSLKYVTGNEVMVSRVSKTDDCQHIVENTLASYGKYALPFKWAVGPMSTPEILEPLLTPLADESWGFRGMVIDTNTPPTVSEQSDRVVVERVTQLNFDEYVNTFVKGWDAEHLRARFRHNTLQVINNETSPGVPEQRHYLARIDGEPVGSAGTVMKNGFGYLIAANTLEKYRGAGAYRALIRARLRDLAETGRSFAVTQAREATSAPILERLGFETAYKAKIFRFDARPK